MSDLQLTSVMTMWAAWMTARSLSPRTIQERVDRATACLGATASTWHGITADEIVRWLADLDVSAASRATYFGHLKAFFDCDWKDNTDEGDIVHTEVCEEEELFLATGDKSAVKVWVEGMKDEAPGGYAVISDEYALTTSLEVS